MRILEFGFQLYFLGDLFALQYSRPRDGAYFGSDASPRLAPISFLPPGLLPKSSNHPTFLQSDQCNRCLVVILLFHSRMVKRKVIEDSDDEENGEPTPPRPSATGLSDITLSTIVSLDGSASREMQEQIADPSTSSTGLYHFRCLTHLPTEADQFKELLNRESRAAHKSLIEPTPKSTLPATRTYNSSQQQSPTSPTPSYMKTKRSKTSVETPKAKKPLKTYGKSSQNIFEFHGSSDGELDGAGRMKLGHKAEKRSNKNAKIDRAAGRQAFQDEEFTRRPIVSSGGDTESLSTEPNPHEVSSAGGKDVSLQDPMPPPASKFTSFAQSQWSQTSTMPTMADPTPPNPATSSVLSPTRSTNFETYSDDQMPNTSRSLRGEPDEEGSRGSTKSVKLNSVRSNEAMKTIDLRPTEEPAPSSSASEISPSKTITVRRTDHTNNVSQELSSHLDSEHLYSPLDLNISTMVNPVVLSPAPTDTEGQDELSLSIPETTSKSPTKPGKSSKRKRGMDNESVDDLGSGDNAIGVPKEHYQPRPSKRRSGDRDEEVLVPTDFSKKPEAIAKGKRKPKRHKTTAFQELLPKDEDEDEEIKVVPDPRFEIPEKKPPKISTERHQREVERKDDTEEIRPETQPEPKQAAKAIGQKKRGRPKKTVTNLSEETVADEAEAEADHDQSVDETEEPVISATAKKSRKKSKTKETPTCNTDEQDSTNDAAPAIENDSEELPANPLTEINTNTTPSKLAAKPPPEKSPLKSTRPPETPHKTTTPAPKGPDKHSPISSGKVAYRVGLSKRARIAPLLRIVRK